jgi:hypothetical protein
MRHRLYFVLPDLASAIRTANDLLLARVEHRHMHFLGRRGMSLGELHEASYVQKSDLRHALWVGIGVGALCGMVLGIVLRMVPIGGIEFGVGTFMLCAIGGAAFGAWASTLVGLSTPNRDLVRFGSELEAGRILLMLDVPAARVEEIRQLVERSHPEARDHGEDPAIPAFP